MPIIDVLHLVVIVAALGMGAWSLIAYRTAIPRGRFIVFGATSAGALFGCAALSGEVGFLPPAAWFVIVFAAMLAVVLVAQRLARARLSAS